MEACVARSALLSTNVGTASAMGLLDTIFASTRHFLLALLSVLVIVLVASLA